MGFNVKMKIETKKIYKWLPIITKDSKQLIIANAG